MKVGLGSVGLIEDAYTFGSAAYKGYKKAYKNYDKNNKKSRKRSR